MIELSDVGALHKTNSSRLISFNRPLASGLVRRGYLPPRVSPLHEQRGTVPVDSIFQ